MRASSLDLRSHLVQAIRSGLSKADAARIFGVSVRTINRSLKQLAETESLAAKPLPGRRRQLSPDQHPELEAQLRTHDDATLAQQCVRWEAHHGVRVSQATMSRAIARLSWTRKKSRWWPASKTPTRAGSGGTRWPSAMPARSSSSTSRAPT